MAHVLGLAIFTRNSSSFASLSDVPLVRRDNFTSDVLMLCPCDEASSLFAAARSHDVAVEVNRVWLLCLGAQLSDLWRASNYRSCWSVAYHLMQLIASKEVWI